MRMILLIVALALAACHVIEPEGRQQTTTFITSLTRQEVRARAEGWLSERALYRVTQSDPSFVRGEKQRPRSVGPGEQIDTQSVTMHTVAEGTEVEVQSVTFLLGPGDDRERADQLSPEGETDHTLLVQVLMPQPF